MVGQDGEIAGIGHGTAELAEDRARRLHQLAVGLRGLAHDLRRHGFKGHVLIRALPQTQTAAPGLLDPGLKQPAALRQGVVQGHMPGLGNASQA